MAKYYIGFNGLILETTKEQAQKIYKQYRNWEKRTSFDIKCKWEFWNEYDIEKELSITIGVKTEYEKK